MRVSAIIMVFAWMLLIIFPSAVLAGSSSVSDRYRSEARQWEVSLLEAKQVLMDSDPADWEDWQIEGYLSSALWAVYCGAMAYVLDGYRELPDDLDSILNEGYITTWPGNPYNEWEPMQVLAVHDDFIPGEICLQVAPSSFTPERSRMDSFQICVYGPDVEFASYGNAEVLEQNETWAIVPSGALYMLGMY